MKIPLSSTLPDAVQKLLGLAGSPGTVKEALVGAIVTVTAVWLVFKGLLWIKKHKP